MQPEAYTRLFVPWQHPVTKDRSGELRPINTTLDKYLEKPRKLVPKTKMTFAGLKKPQDRADVIAYLKTFK